MPVGRIFIMVGEEPVDATPFSVTVGENSPSSLTPTTTLTRPDGAAPRRMDSAFATSLFLGSWMSLDAPPHASERKDTGYDLGYEDMSCGKSPSLQTFASSLSR